MKIRPMTQKDKSAVFHILDNTPEFNAIDLEVAKEVVSDYLADPKGSGYNVLVAEVESEIAGYVSYGKNTMTESTWDIYWAAVSRDHQGKGIGQALIKTAEDNIKAAGGKLMMIETSSLPTYDRTNRFHVQMGYKKVCQIADFYAPGDDLIMYEKRA